jgi:hypothetical protein
MLENSIIILTACIIVYLINHFLGGHFVDNLSMIAAEFKSLASLQGNARALNALIIGVISIIAGISLLSTEIDHIIGIIAGSHSGLSGPVMALVWAVVIVVSGLFCIKPRPV